MTPSGAQPKPGISGAGEGRGRWRLWDDTRHARVFSLASALVAALAFARPLPSLSQVTIREFMAANNTVIANAMGVTADWIELHNTSTATVDLAGWHLTDNGNELTLWTFPSTNIAAGAYLLVYASGEDGVISNELHTSFQLDRGGECKCYGTTRRSHEKNPVHRNRTVLRDGKPVGR